MSADYCRLLSELQEAKKEISSLRNKNNTLSGIPTLTQLTILYWNPMLLLSRGLSPLSGIQ